ncbi:ABC transporter substrate-binding protein [Oscillospiraceae bacterium 50-60]
MKMYQRILSLSLAILLLLSLAACGQRPDIPDTSSTAPQGDAQELVPTDPPSPPEAVQTRFAALKGPTAMGLVHLMSTPGIGEHWTFTLAGSADEVTPALIKGDLDVACVPANLASVLYNKTEGGVVCLAVNTLGVLYIVENGDEIQSVADLAGKTIVSAGKGSTPEYGLRYLLSENGVDPDKDVTIDWKSEHSECVAALASGAATVAMLPQPFVTAAQNKLEHLRVALDLTAEWDALDNGSAMITGVAVARRAFAEEHPETVEGFLQYYAQSVDWVNGNPAEAAELIAAYGIIESAAIAEQALPHCNIVCLTGQEMYEKLSGYLQVLSEAAPEAVGGALPRDDFFYGA